jgi:hypothetical protein
VAVAPPVSWHLGRASPPRARCRVPATASRTATNTWSTNDLMRTAELELAQQAETSYKRMVQDQQADKPGEESGRERDTGARIDVGHSKRTSCAADHKLLTSALRYVIGSRPIPQPTPPPHTPRDQEQLAPRKYRPTT